MGKGVIVTLRRNTSDLPLQDELGPPATYVVAVENITDRDMAERVTKALRKVLAKEGAPCSD